MRRVADFQTPRFFRFLSREKNCQLLPRKQKKNFGLWTCQQQDPDKTPLKIYEGDQVSFILSKRTSKGKVTKNLQDICRHSE